MQMLTEQGDIVLRYARRILELNDEMLDSVRGASLSGTVRAGFARDFVETILPHALTRFSALYPLVQLEVQIDRNMVLEQQIKEAKLDVALTLGDAKHRTATKLGELPLKWIASPRFVEIKSEPLPLVLFAHPCIFRSRALDALQQARRAWRIALTSPSLAGLWAAVYANLGITVRPQTGAPPKMHFSLPNMPDPGAVDVALHYASKGKATHIRRFAEIVGELFDAQYAPAPVENNPQA
jgi:DNA-binding transcriptional LysR family regulator